MEWLKNFLFFLVLMGILLSVMIVPVMMMVWIEEKTGMAWPGFILIFLFVCAIAATRVTVMTRNAP